MTDTMKIYSDIETRTGGNIYIGVVGPVRTGKSTFINRFLESIVIPNIEGEAEKGRAVDEMPQSSGGKTIMTTEPKFIPEEAVSIQIGDKAHLKVRLVDCVGYVVPSAIGYIEDELPRMVRTPWSEEEIPFHTAAQIGTKKVIDEHSTIGLVVTTDGSITDIPREEYAIAEQRVIEELKAIHKPFVVLLNSTRPEDESVQELAQKMQEDYGVQVIPVNCLELNEKTIKEILSAVLFEFPLSQVEIKVPEWILSLDKAHWLKSGILESISAVTLSTEHLRDVTKICDKLLESEYVTSAQIDKIELSDGSAAISIQMPEALFYKVLAEKTGVEVTNEKELMRIIGELSDTKQKYDKVKNALDEVERTGYGIVMPELEELSLEEPEIMKQGGRYGVRLKASAPSIHMLRADIMTEVAPIVGSESQSEDLVLYLMKQFEENPNDIWNSDIFGKSIYSIVNEGLNSKLARMPMDARGKLRETVERVINEGCNGLICIIL
ncbi:MAG: stage IV sporulation protein A [Clostridia bacterium]|nr:stage IV sporulation protein A [Clostridia bacterium]